MNKLFIMMMMAAAFTACGHRASDSSTADADSLGIDSVAEAQSLVIEQIEQEREDSMVIVGVSAEWPVSGPEALVNNIRQYLCDELATNPMGEGKPKVKMTNDGKAAVEATFKSQCRELASQWKEARNEGFDGEMPYEFKIHSQKFEETDTYITYVTNCEGFMGGAHGYFISTGQTFRKSDGKRIGYETEYNEKTEKFKTKKQTLFADTKSPKFYALLKEGVRSYFKDNDMKISSDEEMKDFLQGVDDVDHLPLPSAPPFFTKKGLCFTYQQYEIAPYAAGIISFNIDYDQVHPFLTKEALECVPQMKN